MFGFHMGSPEWWPALGMMVVMSPILIPIYIGSRVMGKLKGRSE